MRKITLITLTAAALPFAAHSATTEFSYGGFIKADAMYTKYEYKTDTRRDNKFYIPGVMPTKDTEVASGNDLAFDTDIRSSRFNFGTKTTFDNGEEIKSFIEIDFLGHAGDETGAAVNAHSLRIRHAFITYNNLTIGHTWSTFMNVGALPEAVDFIGPSDGTVFKRNDQVRYTNGGLQIAIENSYSSYNVGPDNIAGSKHGTIPDVVARYNFSTGAADLSVAALFHTEEDWSNDKTKSGYGINAAGVIKLGSDNLKFSISHGDGIKNYVGVGQAPLMDGNDLNTITAGFVAYQHAWNNKLRSSITYSMLDSDADWKSDSARVNLMYSPVDSFTYGVEYSHAQVDKAGDKGSFDRLHVTAKYSF